jgi:hypothetical protein
MDKKSAWYSDEDLLLEGIVVGNAFYPNTKLCGFDIQEFDETMVNREVFFDLQKAIVVCGDVPVIQN